MLGRSGEDDRNKRSGGVTDSKYIMIVQEGLQGSRSVKLRRFKVALDRTWGMSDFFKDGII